MPVTTETLVVRTRGIVGRRLLVDDLGVRRGRALLAWSELNYYAYDWHDWTRPGDFVLVSKRGRVLRIAPVFDHWRAAADRIIACAHAALANAVFHPFGLEGDTLIFGRTELPLADITRVEIAAVGRDTIFVVHAGGREWASVELAEVCNVFLLLSQLAERGVVITSQLPIDLPPVLAPLARAIATDVELPAARLL